MILSPGPEAAGLVPLLAASMAALAAYGLAALRPDARWLGKALGLAWCAHALAIGLHAAGIGGDAPGARFGFAPALSVTVWLVITVYAVESRFVQLAGAGRWLALLGAAAVALMLGFPGELRERSASPWAPLHWLLGIASYGLFGAAVLHAALLKRSENALRGRPQVALDAPVGTAAGTPLLRLERLTFRFVAAGFVGLSATLLLGWIAAPWRWDHKSVFSVLAWLVFALLLAGRRSFGWRGRHAARWLYAGAALLLLAYAGSRFVLEVLLHRAAPG